MTNVWGHESEKRGRETHTAAAAAAAFVRFVAIQPADGTATTRRQCVTWLRRGERKGDRFFSSAAPFVWELLPGTVTHNKHAPTSWRHHLCGESPMPLFFSLLLNTSSQRFKFSSKSQISFIFVLHCHVCVSNQLSRGALVFCLARWWVKLLVCYSSTVLYIEVRCRIFEYARRLKTWKSRACTW